MNAIKYSFSAGTMMVVAACLLCGTMTAASESTSSGKGDLGSDVHNGIVTAYDFLSNFISSGYVSNSSLMSGSIDFGPDVKSFGTYAYFTGVSRAGDNVYVEVVIDPLGDKTQKYRNSGNWTSVSEKLFLVNGLQTIHSFSDLMQVFKEGYALGVSKDLLELEMDVRGVAFLTSDEMWIIRLPQGASDEVLMLSTLLPPSLVRD